MKFLIVGFVVFSILSYATSLSCYECLSDDDESCDDERLIECDEISAAAGLAILVKLKPTTQIIHHSINYKCYKLVAERNLSDDQLTFKSCIYDTVGVCDGAMLYAQHKECYTCAEDKCNGSDRLTTSAYLAVLGLLGIFWTVGN
ncbi:uncharacterized protein LOC134226635 [Armigeres subalbatus]|uniref:uncharacterized protein LOC134226635 n=1 Tax=Armigeres subalbatus TaxID=124917 RepID=UPI002ED40147